MPSMGVQKNVWWAIVGCPLGILIWVALAVMGPAQSGVVVTITTQSATTLTIGSAFLWTAKTANNTSGALTLGNNLFLTYPDGTRIQIEPGVGARSLASGSSFKVSRTSTTSVYTSQTGTFTFEVDAVDTGGNVLATATTTFTILALPASLIAPRFTDIAASAGVAAIHHSDPTDCLNMIGTGAGWADYDGDGLLDLFVSDFNGASHLYHNNGNLTFTETTSKAGIPFIFRASGVSWADYNNDGHPDLLVLTDGTAHLFQNNGNGTFTDVSKSAGLTAATGRGTTAAWGDYDSDGWLDLYVVNYAECTVPITTRVPDRLYHNNKDGTFTDVTNLLGGVTSQAVLGLGFSATWFDFNNDNRPDLYVVNDKGMLFTPNILWRNDGSDAKGGWIFTQAPFSGTNKAMFAMGLAIGDYNRDGLLDIGISNMGNNVLLRNDGNSAFTEKDREAGFERTPVSGGDSITWGLGFADFNNDGYEDMFIAGGELGPRDDMPNAVLVNNLNSHLTGVSNDGVFLDLTYRSKAGDPAASRTVALADFDADGWMDAIVINYFDKVPRLYRNEGIADGNTNRWIEVRLVGTSSNRDGVGAKLTLTAGGENQYRQIISGTSLGAGSQVAAHFGLGAHTQADTLQILWPSGQVQTFANLAANQRWVITEGSSVPGHDPTPPWVPSPDSGSPDN